MITSNPAALDVALQCNVIASAPEAPEFAAALAPIAAAGYRRVVLPPTAVLDRTSLAVATELLRSHGLEPIVMAGQGGDADVSSADGTIRANGAASLRNAVDAAASVGCDELNGALYGPFGKPGARQTEADFLRSATAVGEIADYGAANGVKVTFEVLNRYETSLINTAEQAMSYCEASGSEALGIHLDTFHMSIEETDILAAIELALPRLAYLELGQSSRGSLATGQVDIPAIVRGAVAAGYQGRWGYEAFARDLISTGDADALAIWRDPYADGIGVATEAMSIIRGALTEQVRA